MKIREAYLIIMFRLPFGLGCFFLTEDQLIKAFAFEFMRKNRKILEMFD